MTFLESDVPVQAPRLLDLSAEFVANNLVEIFPIKTNDNDNDNDDNVGNDNEQQQHDVHMDGSTNDNCANYNNIITNADDGGSGNNGNHSNNGGGFESKDECDMEIDEELCGDNANVRREKCDIEDLVLPLPCSTATLSALRKKWIQTVCFIFFCLFKNIIFFINYRSLIFFFFFFKEHSPLLLRIIPLACRVRQICQRMRC